MKKYLIKRSNQALEQLGRYFIKEQMSKNKEQRTNMVGSSWDYIELVV